jgi:hypothetical protein
MGNATQELNQKILQKYGWSATYGTTTDGSFWYADITVGINDTRRFCSVNNRSPAETKAGVKRGTASAAAAAIKGLRNEININEAIPVKELVNVFPKQILILVSNEEAWENFWNHKPEIVGIDTEGNQRAPPILLQVSTENYTILEVPGQSISKNVARLLADESIVKVFCDSCSQHDKTCLGLSVRQDVDFTSGPIIDLEALAAKVCGPVTVARGLSRIVTMVMPELDVLIRKPKGQGRFTKVGRFALIEQGKAPPLKSIDELTFEEKQYAALDAWCTLYAYRRLQELSVVES